MNPENGILFQLVKMKFVTEERVEEIAFEAGISPENPLMVSKLVEQGVVNCEQVAMATGEHFNLGYVNLWGIPQDDHRTDLIDAEVARFLRCAPFMKDSETLQVAVEDPSHDSCMIIVARFFDDTDVVVASKRGMDYALSRYYPISNRGKIMPTRHSQGESKSSSLTVRRSIGKSGAKTQTEIVQPELGVHTTGTGTNRVSR